MYALLEAENLIAYLVENGLGFPPICGMCYCMYGHFFIHGNIDFIQPFGTSLCAQFLSFTNQ